MPAQTWFTEGWTVRATAGPVPEGVKDRRVIATVPGCVSTDLLAAGLLPDPYIGENEALHAWVGRSGWCYQTTFAARAPGPGERADLVCLGLDTVATVRLNGRVVAQTANMHRSYRFDVRDVLAEGQNELTIEFEAPVDAAERMSNELGARPDNSAHPFNAIRKMACNYGWDWGPDLATAGIWRPIGLHRWRQARIVSVRPVVSVEVGGDGVAGDPRAADASAPRWARGLVEVHVDLERGPGDDAELALELEASVGGQSVTCVVPPGDDKAVLSLAAGQVELWWPAGYGRQPLYDLEVTLRPATGTAAAGGPVGGAGTVLDQWKGRIGFRSVELDTRPDERGARLGFVVNGRAVQVRGANWIPDDCFVTRVGRDRYRARLEQAKQANINLLRVWGGGIYESEDFYSSADELGLLVWQDFMLACAAYAEEDPLRSEIVAEAREAVTRLCRHPSLAAWSGSNENIWGHEDWGWKEVLGDKTWGAAYYYEIFPAIVGELDPGRPYMAGSPWSLGYDAHPNDARFGSMHVWDVWNRKDYVAYREHQPQFVAEFGFQGPPMWPTLSRALTARPLRLESPELAVHQKAADGMEKLARSLDAHFAAPRSFEDWWWATALNQARAVALGVEYWRSLVPPCRGTIVWQLNDCWPVISWSLVDGDGRRKPVWYALRRSYADRLLTVQPGWDAPDAEALARGGPLVVVAVNDGADNWSTTFEVTRQDFFGKVKAAQTLRLSAVSGERASSTIDQDVATSEDPAREVLVVTGEDGQRAMWFYAPDKDLALPEHALDLKVEAAGDGYDVAVSASSLQRDVALLADVVDPGASVDEMVFTLLAGESRRLHVCSAQRLSPESLAQPSVLRSANQLRYL